MLKATSLKDLLRPTAIIWDSFTSRLWSLSGVAATHRYPTNPVLRAITPKDTVRPMDIFPVKLTQDAIMVDVSGAATTKFQGAGRGGADTSIDANNVFALQPRTYLEGTGPDGRRRRLVQLQGRGRGPRGALVAVWHGREWPWSLSSGVERTPRALRAYKRRPRT